MSERDELDGDAGAQSETHVEHTGLAAHVGAGTTEHWFHLWKELVDRADEHQVQMLMIRRTYGHLKAAVELGQPRERVAELVEQLGRDLDAGKRRNEPAAEEAGEPQVRPIKSWFADSDDDEVACS